MRSYIYKYKRRCIICGFCRVLRQRPRKRVLKYPCPECGNFTLTGVAIKVKQRTNGQKNGQLSQKSVEVLQYEIQGLTDKEVACLLGVSINCIGKRWERLKSKLGARTRTQAVVYAIQGGFLDVL